MAGTGTVSLVDEAEPRDADATHETLLLVMNAGRPFDDPVGATLAMVDDVVLGRGPATAVLHSGPRSLRVDLADAAVSTVHSTLARGWTLSDEGSKNGTLVNGRRVERAALDPQDLLELGNCFFFLRRGMVAAQESAPGLRTHNASLARTLKLFARVARSKVPLLVAGESGTGKEVLARAAHELSGRSGPFVAVNCAAIPEALVASELFGARRGAFTGAASDRSGSVAAAHGGTLFLDEIADLPEPTQGALLRVLQEGEVVPLGQTKPISVDVRVVAATNQDLAARVVSGRFRDDLYARLRGEVIALPPLRARREDLGLLCAQLLARAAGARARTLTFHRTAARALLLHAWPHNIRELGHVLQRAVSLLEGDEIRLAHLPADIAAPLEKPLDPLRDERARLVELLRVHRGNISAVARALATSRSQVRRLLDRHAVDADAEGDEED